MLCPAAALDTFTLYVYPTTLPPAPIVADPIYDPPMCYDCGYVPSLEFGKVEPRGDWLAL